MALSIVCLTSSHAILSFDCGEDQLNRHLKSDARKENEDNLATTYVAVDSAAQAEVHGFYCLRVSERSNSEKPDGLKLKGISLPIVIATHFGVQIAKQKQGIGETMLFDLFRRVQIVSGHVGCYAVFLQAISDDVANFYKKYGMKAYGPDASKLWIPVSDIKKFELL